MGRRYWTRPWRWTTRSRRGRCEEPGRNDNERFVAGATYIRRDGPSRASRVRKRIRFVSRFETVSRQKTIASIAARAFSASPSLRLSTYSLTPRSRRPPLGATSAAQPRVVFVFVFVFVFRFVFVFVFVRHPPSPRGSGRPAGHQPNTPLAFERPSSRSAHSPTAERSRRPEPPLVRKRPPEASTSRGGARRLRPRPRPRPRAPSVPEQSQRLSRARASCAACAWAAPEPPTPARPRSRSRRGDNRVLAARAVRAFRGEPLVYARLVERVLALELANLITLVVLVQAHRAHVVRAVPCRRRGFRRFILARRKHHVRARSRARLHLLQARDAVPRGAR